MAKCSSTIPQSRNHSKARSCSLFIIVQFLMNLMCSAICAFARVPPSKIQPDVEGLLEGRLQASRTYTIHVIWYRYRRDKSIWLWKQPNFAHSHIDRFDSSAWSAWNLSIGLGAAFSAAHPHARGLQSLILSCIHCLKSSIPKRSKSSSPLIFHLKAEEIKPGIFLYTNACIMYTASHLLHMHLLVLYYIHLHI